MNIHVLHSKLREIAENKFRELKILEKNEPDSIDCKTLNCEINDAQYMMIHINSSESHKNKVSAIRAIFKITTSKSIYNVVREFLKQEGAL